MPHLVLSARIENRISFGLIATRLIRTRDGSMAHHDKRFRPHLVRLEDRNAASDTLNAVLANLGVSSLFGSNPADTAIFASPLILIRG